MNSRDVSFGPTSPYRGWRLRLDQGSESGQILVQIETAAWSRRKYMHGAMVLKPDTRAHAAATQAMEAGPGTPMEFALTALLADLPEQAAAYQATPLQQAHISLISSAGAHARREWEERYPDGVPAFEVIAAGTYDPAADRVAYEHDTAAVAVLPRRNPHPHNEHGTTDDFNG